MLNKLKEEIYANAVSKGFYKNPTSVPTKIALIHSEASEMLEADRANRYAELDEKDIQLMDALSDKAFKRCFIGMVKDTLEDELADTIIRLLDVAGYLEIDIEAHLRLKMRYNAMRTYQHGGKKY